MRTGSFGVRWQARAAGLMLALSAPAVIIAEPGGARASLKPAAGSGAVFQGQGGYTADALGQSEPGGTLQAEVPGGSTVALALLYGTYSFTPSPIPTERRTIDFDGTSVVLQELTHASPGECCNLRAARADVTEHVGAKVGAGGATTNFVVNSDPEGLDGMALVVVFSNASLPETTIAVMDGGADQAGDITSFDFLTPVNKGMPKFSARMSLGSGFSYQGASGHACGTIPQYSTVDVNGRRLTTCAGGYDDGMPEYGALITLGGVGDAPDNPANPNTRGSGTDDELYDLAPFIQDGATHLEIKTANPSGDDLLFLVVIAVTAPANVECSERGLSVLKGTPLDGAVSRTVHEVVEPAVKPVGSDPAVHQINCSVVVPAEAVINGSAAAAPAAPSGILGAR